LYADALSLFPALCLFHKKYSLQETKKAKHIRTNKHTRKYKYSSTMPRKAAFKGLDALVVTAHDNTERTAQIGGQAHFHGAHFTGDVIVKDELHAHDVINSVRHIPDNSRWVVSTTEVGTLFVLPRCCEIFLPTAPPTHVPMCFELVGVNINRLTLKTADGRTLFAPTSYIVYNGENVSVASEENQESGFVFAGVNMVQLRVQSTVEHTAAGTAVFKYRVTGTMSLKHTCSVEDDVVCECMVSAK
jgi:hypothetical protein